MLHIYVDADACPVKQEVYRVARRYQLQVTVVANTRMQVPDEPEIRLEVVEGGLDVADDWIVERVEEGDIVITGDIPLASRCLKRRALVLGTTGKPFTDNNIGQVLATRDLMADLRDAGALTGGPAPLQPRDRSRFMQRLDEMVQSVRRQPLDPSHCRRDP